MVLLVPYLGTAAAWEYLIRFWDYLTEDADRQCLWKTWPQPPQECTCAAEAGPAPEPTMSALERSRSIWEWVQGVASHCMHQAWYSLCWLLVVWGAIRHYLG